MTIRWTPRALSDLEQIHDYIGRDNPDAAVRTVHAILKRVEQLLIFPELGRPQARAGVRELVSSPLPYLVDYRVQDACVEILDIWHGA